MGYPSDPICLTLTFSVARTLPPNPCKMKSGTGTFDAQSPSDPTAPSAQGTFSFKARDSKTVTLSGEVTSSSVSVLFPSDPMRGFVTYPPSPCTGGTAQASISFLTG